MRMFFIGILAIRLLSLPILFSSGSSTSGPDWTITNSPFVLISETSNIVPYQFTEILDNISGLAKMSFNFTGGSFPQV
jgi:hypothetical protein